MEATFITTADVETGDEEIHVAYIPETEEELEALFAKYTADEDE